MVGHYLPTYLPMALLSVSRRRAILKFKVDTCPYRPFNIKRILMTNYADYVINFFTEHHKFFQ